MTNLTIEVFKTRKNRWSARATFTGPRGGQVRTQRVTPSQTPEDASSSAVARAYHLEHQILREMRERVAS